MAAGVAQPRIMILTSIARSPVCPEAAAAGKLTLLVGADARRPRARAAISGADRQHDPAFRRGRHRYCVQADLLVTASGSGLDPHLSPAAAKIQVKRIALVRKLDEEKLNSLVNEYTKKPLLGMLGPATVNVLELNIALDKLK